MHSIRSVVTVVSVESLLNQLSTWIKLIQDVISILLTSSSEGDYLVPLADCLETFTSPWSDVYLHVLDLFFGYI